MQVADLLAPLGPVVTRPLLGGCGLYLDDRIFAIVHDDRVYFRTCAATIDRYLHAGAESFIHHRDGGPDSVLPYREVPAGVLADRDEACAWAYAAVAGD